MMTYEIVAATDITVFRSLVNSVLKDGWKLRGNVQVTPHQDLRGHGMQYTQAFVKEVDTNTRPPISKPKPADKVRNS